MKATAVLLVSLAATLASAQPPAAAGSVTGSRETLKAACQVTSSWDSQRQYETWESALSLQCATFIRGVIDGMMAAEVFEDENAKQERRVRSKRLACFRGSYEVRLVSAAVLGLLEERDFAGAPPGLLVAVAVRKVFACG